MSFVGGLEREGGHTMALGLVFEVVWGLDLEGEVKACC